MGRAKQRKRQSDASSRMSGSEQRDGKAGFAWQRGGIAVRGTGRGCKAQRCSDAQGLGKAGLFMATAWHCAASHRGGKAMRHVATATPSLPTPRQGCARHGPQRTAAAKRGMPRMGTAAQWTAMALLRNSERRHGKSQRGCGTAGRGSAAEQQSPALSGQGIAAKRRSIGQRRHSVALLRRSTAAQRDGEAWFSPARQRRSTARQRTAADGHCDAPRRERLALRSGGIAWDGIAPAWHCLA